MIKQSIVTNEQIRYIGVLFVVTIVLALNTRVPDVTHINADQAKYLIDNGAVVLDVREKSQFDIRHIEDAISLPLSMINAGIPLEFVNIKARNIVIYCGDGAKIGPVATDILNKAGYSKAVNLKAGISGWADAGYPVIVSSA